MLREVAENPQPHRQCDVHRSACDTRICQHAYDEPLGATIRRLNQADADRYRNEHPGWLEG